jgi:hypothetical protein
LVGTVVVVGTVVAVFEIVGVSTGMVGVIGVLLGTGVSVGGLVAVLVGVLVGGIGVRVRVGTGVFVGSGLGRRVLVGSLDVGKINTTGVLDIATVGLAVNVGCGGGSVEVEVAASSENASRVTAAAVFKFSTKDSTTSPASRAMAVATFRSCTAMPETEHNRLIPRIPARKTHSNPRYALSFTPDTFL